MADIKKLSAKEKDTKLAELKLELTKAMNKSSQSKGKTKELKRAISRILTLNNSTKEELKKN
jgi:ribosomal protein L29